MKLRVTTRELPLIHRIKKQLGKKRFFLSLFAPATKKEKERERNRESYEGL